VSPKKEEKQTAGFEESLQKLEEIVQQMEDGELSLDEMITRFEEGSKLVKVCGEKLTEVEQKIQVLVQGNDGKPSLKDFDDDSAQLKKETT